MRPKTPLELAALATAAVPGLSVAGLREPQFADEVLSVTGIIDSAGNKWTVTCPHSSVGGLDLDAQSGVLTRLAKAKDAKKIPFDVPRIHGTTLTPEGDRVIVHQDLGGHPMSDDDFDNPNLLPDSLGKALAALHNLPPVIYTGINLPAYSVSECRERHLAMLDEVASQVLIPANLWNRWEAALEDLSLWRFPAAPIHGDIQGNSVIVEAGIVRAMTGFTSAHVGDPAQDIAWVLASASDAFLERFRAAYSQERTVADLQLFTRAQLLSELAIVRWLVHGLHAEDRSIISDARHMLSELSTDLGDAQIVERPHAHVAQTQDSQASDSGTTAPSAPSPASSASVPSPSVSSASDSASSSRRAPAFSTSSFAGAELANQKTEVIDFNVVAGRLGAANLSDSDDYSDSGDYAAPDRCADDDSYSEVDADCDQDAPEEKASLATRFGLPASLFTRFGRHGRHGHDVETLLADYDDANKRVDDNRADDDDPQQSGSQSESDSASTSSAPSPSSVLRASTDVNEAPTERLHFLDQE
ncbi:phosphotransferase [Schaalia turicensis]|uniref:phosphotransferase n=1 Tax=Schaalia turicensis TaxID=131111 RepID=UPI002151158C|nr:phosphotransferase [Schaalia turicensis]